MIQAAEPSTKIIRIVIADDHPIVREGLVAVLNAHANMTVVGEASNGREAIELFRKHEPDIALLDLRMPEMGGVEAIRTIRSEYPDACIIMLTIYDTDEDIYQGLRAGAKAYLLKETPCEELVEVIQIVSEGSRYIPRAIGEKLAARTERPSLSDRELDVLKLLGNGKSNKAIALELTISENTVRFHVNNLLRKLNARDRTTVVVNALRNGTIKL
ncbi:MAG: response regulator transcription factor [Cyanobacteria bacterium P01_H01_bin.15]